MPNVIDRTLEKNEFRDVLLNKFEIRVAAQVRDVIDGASDEVVDADDLVPAREQQVGQVGAEKPGGASDDTDGSGSFGGCHRGFTRERRRSVSSSPGSRSCQDDWHGAPQDFQVEPE